MKYEINQFDVVQILTTKNIDYLTHPKGVPTNPKGLWSVVGFFDTKAILAKERTMIRIPVTDVKIDKSYNLQSFLDKLEDKDE